MRGSAYTGLRCTNCRMQFEAGTLVSRCTRCNSPLDTLFDDRILQGVRKASLPNIESMWRFRAFLPVGNAQKIVSAGEGATPLRRLKSYKGRVWAKDETRNPTGTFKDRGASLAVTVLHELGVQGLALASEGNAGCSFALYAGMADLGCSVFLPKMANPAKVQLSKRLGAKVVQAGKTIGDVGRLAAARSARSRAYNASTFVTPFRHDGKGTMAMEICEASRWTSPDFVIYPVGGGVGLVGMWKMFKTLKRIGWIQNTPRFVAVQPKGCAPIVKAFNAGREDVEEWVSPNTIALGLRIPNPFAGRWILATLKESNSITRTVTDQETLKVMRSIIRDEGLLLEPSSAAAFAALPRLYDEGTVDPTDRVVVIATGSGLKTIESL